LVIAQDAEKKVSKKKKKKSAGPSFWKAMKQDVAEETPKEGGLSSLISLVNA